MTAEDPKEDWGTFGSARLTWKPAGSRKPRSRCGETLELSPQFSLVFQFLGKCLLQLNQKEQAIQELRRAIRSPRSAAKIVRATKWPRC